MPGWSDFWSYRKTVLNNLSRLYNIANAVDNILPQLEDEVTVIVHGMPQNRTRMSDLYQVAAAAAFGVIKNRSWQGFIPPAGVIQIEYSPDASFVKFTILYKKSISSAYLSGVISGSGIKQTFLTSPVFGNLKDNVVGGPFNYASGVADIQGAKVTLVPDVGQNPTLKYDGKTILTRSPNQTFLGAGVKPAANPQPPADGVSRSSLVNLIAACLSNTGTTQGMLFQPPTGQAPPPAATGGST
ncbi:MAG: hypothetical protein JWO38_932 [Gemmataceae bacterium]|nr:hypothetical protein [Gemmataceae bacterium]